MTAGAPDPYERMLQAATAELAAREHRETVPESLMNNVMRGVWTELRRSRMLPLPDVSGPAFVAQHVVTTVLARALASLGTVELRSSALQPDDLAYTSVTVRIVLALRYGANLGQLTRRVREVVRASVAEQFGWTVRTIDIDVADVLDEPAG